MGKKRPKIMSKSSMSFNWKKLPEYIFGYIMMKVGLESMDNLHICRQVCKSWNEMIVSGLIPGKAHS